MCYKNELSGLTVCDRLVMWLARPDVVLDDIRNGLEEKGCRVKIVDRELIAWCKGCILKISIWDEDTSKMMESLGTIAKEAVKQGYRAVGLEIKVSDICVWLCEAVNLLLMKGGG